MMAHDHGGGVGGSTAAFHSTPPTTWGHHTPHIYPRSHHGTPALEYTGFNFGSPHAQTASSTFAHGVPQRSMQSQLQPLVMPQWPSELHSAGYQGYHVPQIRPDAPVLGQPAHQPRSARTPISAASRKSPSSTPRKTLTDDDRKRMCEYAEKHPTAKQMEIGNKFGVERSTVSKVLRQRDKYMRRDERSQSPAKRTKGKDPDIERALAVWANNTVRKGRQLTDEMILEQIHAFTATTSRFRNRQPTTPQWLEKFKLKYNIMNARSSRRSSYTTTDDNESVSPTNGSTTQRDSTSTSKSETPPSPPPDMELQNAGSVELKAPGDTVGGFTGFLSTDPFAAHHGEHSNATFDDAMASHFAYGSMSPTSPYFTPSSGADSSPFIPVLPLARHASLLPSTASSNLNRPRSQTFPAPDQYSGSSAMSDSITPGFMVASTLDSPMEDTPEIGANITHTMMAQPHLHKSHSFDGNTVMPSETMRPPPLPSHVVPADARRGVVRSISASALDGMQAPYRHAATATFDDARHALEVVMDFIQQPTHDLALDHEEMQVMSRLLGKFNLPVAAQGTPDVTGVLSTGTLESREFFL